MSFVCVCVCFCFFLFRYSALSWAVKSIKEQKTVHTCLQTVLTKMDASLDDRATHIKHAMPSNLKSFLKDSKDDPSQEHVAVAARLVTTWIEENPHKVFLKKDLVSWVKNFRDQINTLTLQGWPRKLTIKRFVYDLYSFYSARCDDTTYAGIAFHCRMVGKIDFVLPKRSAEEVIAACTKTMKLTKSLRSLNPNKRVQRIARMVTRSRPHSVYSHPPQF